MTKQYYELQWSNKRITGPFDNRKEVLQRIRESASREIHVTEIWIRTLEIVTPAEFRRKSK